MRRRRRARRYYRCDGRRRRNLLVVVSWRMGRGQGRRRGQWVVYVVHRLVAPSVVMKVGVGIRPHAMWMKPGRRMQRNVRRGHAIAVVVTRREVGSGCTKVTTWLAVSVFFVAGAATAASGSLFSSFGPGESRLKRGDVSQCRQCRRFVSSGLNIMVLDGRGCHKLHGIASCQRVLE